MAHLLRELQIPNGCDWQRAAGFLQAAGYRLKSAQRGYLLISNKIL